MAFEFRLPSIGDAHSEAEITEWLVEVGDELARDQDLLEVETAKAAVVIPSPHAGVLLARFGEAGDVIDVGTLLAVIGEEGESWSEGDGGTEEIPATAAPATEESPAPEGARQESSDEGAGGARVQALPAVRRLAVEMGLELSRITGSGPEGRVLTEDVIAAGGSRADEAETAPRAVTGEQVREPLSMRRRTIAANLARRWREVPHASVYHAAHADELMSLRERVREQTGVSVVADALIAKLVQPALREFPDLTSYVEEDEVVRRPNLDLGFAIDSVDGLVVGVVRGVEERGMIELSNEIRGLADRIRAGSAGLEDVEGAVFTISNLGAAGGSSATTILPDRHSAMLTVGRARESVVALDGVPTVRATMQLSLTFDHRLIDGGQAIRFLGRAQELIESPTAALLLV